MTQTPALRPAIPLSAALLLVVGTSPAPAQQMAPPDDSAEPAPPAAPTASAAAPSPAGRPAAAPAVPLPAAGQEPPPPAVPQQSYLGVVLEDVTQEDVERLGLPEQRGALIREIVDGSPADSAGLQSGDVILEWRDEAVYSAAELDRLVRETPPGRQVGVTVHRDGERIDLTVTLRERHGPGVSFGGPDVHFRGELLPEARARIRGRLERAREHWGEVQGHLQHLDERLEDLEWFRDDTGDSLSVRRFRFGPMFGSDRARLGVRLQSLTPQLAEYFGLGERRGVLITSVRAGSPADCAGLQAGDVLLSVAGEEVSDPRDAARAVRDAAGEVEIRVLRRGEERTLTARLPERGHGEEDPSDG